MGARTSAGFLWRRQMTRPSGMYTIRWSIPRTRSVPPGSDWGGPSPAGGGGSGVGGGGADGGAEGLGVPAGSAEGQEGLLEVAVGRVGRGDAEPVTVHHGHRIADGGRGAHHGAQILGVPEGSAQRQEALLQMTVAGVDRVHTQPVTMHHGGRGTDGGGGANHGRQVLGVPTGPPQGQEALL